MNNSIIIIAVVFVFIIFVCSLSIFTGASLGYITLSSDRKTTSNSFAKTQNKPTKDYSMNTMKNAISITSQAQISPPPDATKIDTTKPYPLSTSYSTTNYESLFGSCNNSAAQFSVTTYKTIKNETVNAIVGPGGKKLKVRFLYKETHLSPPSFENTKHDISVDTLKIFLCKLDTFLSTLCNDFPDLKCGAGAEWINVYLNKSGINGVHSWDQPGIAALAGNDLMIYGHDIVEKSKSSVRTMDTVVHESTHSITSNLYVPSHLPWGEGMGETVAEAFVAYTLPYSAHVYNTIEHYFTPSERIKNPYSAEALSYTAPGKPYKGIFWLFVIARYGKDKFVNILTSKVLLNAALQKKVSFWQVCATSLNVHLHELCSYWLVDTLTGKYFRDGAIRQSMAVDSKKSQYYKSVDTKTWMWKSFNVISSAASLEAFGFMVFDLHNLMKIERLAYTPGSKLNVILTTTKPAGITDDSTTWIMVSVKKGAYEPVTETFLGNSVRLDVDVTNQPWILGIMHIKTNLMQNGNNVGTSAINFNINLNIV